VHINYLDPRWESIQQDGIDCVADRISHFYSIASGSAIEVSSPTVERVFFWLDTERRVDDSSQITSMTSFLFKLSAENADKIRTLAQGLRSGGYFPGLAERARTIGYFAESMHLQPFDGGTYLLLVHLDHYGFSKP
jgi:hypothetical protein